MNLENKVAVVTGASRGIGKEIACNLAEKGAIAIVNYRGEGEKAEADAVVAEIIEKGGNAKAVQADVTNYEEVENLMNSVNNEFGSLDILVNNAGITNDMLMLRMKEEDFDRVINVNLKGTFNCIKHANRIMLKQRSGSIINISSVVGITGNAGQANYSASKAGIIGLTKSMAQEMAPRGVTVNAIAPGFIETPMTDVLSEKVRQQYVESIPMRRMGTPKDIANAIAFLASDDARYITGQVISVNGGMV